jgi:hypothetical protein
VPVIVATDRARGNTFPPPAGWELHLISLLVVALQARDARIARLEQLDREKAVALDEQRKRGERRAA